MLLSADEQAVLERWAAPARSSALALAPAPALALRARIVLACAGPGVPPIVSVARELRVAADTVRKWRRRFAAERLNGLDGPAGPTAADAAGAAGPTAAGAIDAAGASDAADGSPSDLAAALRRIAELDAELAIHRRAAELLD